ncbi:protein kinase [Cryptosporidium ubiquitum]|uniref:Protein kinase n=1 Tax=Cryptosporidium ubiquitum TaxID=857276 RepID=A0A1J4MPP7_9CRYT|nr:protein kinase [Cryptosporidium ubiquitum]OII74845.1 protein kinase [Cryptosporidium ubiquitum]
MNNELTSTIKNILRINEIKNDDLASILSRYIQKNFLNDTDTDIFAESDYFQEQIIKASMAIAANCNFTNNININREDDVSVNVEEIPIFKNYVEFENFRDLNNWITDLYDRVFFSSKSHFQDKNGIKEKIENLVNEYNDCEIIPFNLPLDFIISIHNTGMISSEKVIDYLRSLHLFTRKDEGNISKHRSDIKDHFLFNEDINIYDDELAECPLECQASQIINKCESERLSFSQIVENQLQKLDNPDKKHQIINFTLRISFSVSGFFENMETELKTLEDIISVFLRTMNSNLKNEINILDKNVIFLNKSNKSQFIHLLRQNVNSLNILNRFLLIKILHRGNFGQIYVGLDLISFKLVCLKRLIGSFSDNQYLKNSIIEANYLKVLSKSAISKFVPYFVDVAVSNNNVFIISELQGKNLLSVIKNDSKKAHLTFGNIQNIIKQLLSCIKYLHESLKLIHCDIKPENIVIDHISAHDIFGYLNNVQTEKSGRINIKLIDWGSCLSIYQASNSRNSYIQSRYYRSPEVCLGLPYNEKIDIWSIGCVMAELVLRRPLFDYNNSTQELLANIVATIGKLPIHMINNSSTIDHFITHDGHLFDKHLNKIRLFTTFHGVSKYKSRISELFDADKDPLFVDLLNKLLCIDPDERLSASQALNHPWFDYNYHN